MWHGIIHCYGKGWLKIFGVVIRVKGDFVQVNIITSVGDLQESCMRVSTNFGKPTSGMTNGS